MRIAIDAVPLLLRSAGVKNYLWHWIRALSQQAGEDEILPWPFLRHLGELHHDASVLPFWATWSRIALLHSVNYLAFPPIDLLSRGAAVFHATNQVRRLPERARITATIHDLTCWLLPELHTPANVRADHGYAERVLKRAARLIAVSESTKRDAVRLLGIPEDRIEVIYSGVAEAFFHVDAAEAGRVYRRYSLHKPYALFVGTIEPRKNLDVLLGAWKRLPQDVLDRYELVIAGPLGWAPPETVARIQSAGSGVRLLGYVPEEDLPDLTAGAEAFVYPSLYEGFGFPVVQAMAAGVSVVTSNVSSLPEVTGGAAVLVDPRSESEIASGLLQVLTSPSLREALGRQGRRQAKKFQWAECARRSLEFFHRAAGQAG